MAPHVPPARFVLAPRPRLGFDVTTAGNIGVIAEDYL